MLDAEGGGVRAPPFDDTSFAFHARESAGYGGGSGREPPRMGNTSPIGVYPFDVYPCKGGKLFSINCSANSTFPVFCNILGVPGQRLSFMD
eukprot:gene43958-62505_t